MSKHYSYRSRAALRAEAKEEDAAHFPIVVAVFASLIALFLSFVGPVSGNTVVLQGEWRIHLTKEKPTLSFAVTDERALVASDGTIKLFEKPVYDKWRRGSLPQEIARASLLGSTRLSRGRSVTKGSVRDDWAVLTTDSGLIFGVSLHQDTLKVAWSNVLDKHTVEAISIHGSGGSNQSLIAYLVARKNAELGSTAQHLLMAIHIQNGTIVWTKEYSNSSRGLLLEKQKLQFDTYPVRRIGYELRPHGEHILCSLPEGAILQPFNTTSERYYFRGYASLTSALEADTDGDGLRESISLFEGEDGCIGILSKGNHWKSDVFYSNCSSTSSLLSLSWEYTHTALIKRQTIQTGASNLFGNLTQTKSLYRGYDVVVFNSRTGEVSCIRADGSSKWNIKPVTGVNTEIAGFGPRLWALNRGDDESDFILSSVAEFGRDYLLIIGEREVAILDTADGRIITSSSMGDRIIKQPTFNGVRLAIILENDSIVFLNLKSYRNFLPPLLLIPVIVTLCMLWACVMWSKLEEI